MLMKISYNIQAMFDPGRICREMSNTRYYGRTQCTVYTLTGPASSTHLPHGLNHSVGVRLQLMHSHSFIHTYTHKHIQDRTKEHVECCVPALQNAVDEACARAHWLEQQLQQAREQGHEQQLAAAAAHEAAMGRMQQVCVCLLTQLHL